MKSVLITGGNGYVATALYEGLKYNHSAIKIGRKEADLTHAGSIKRFFEHRYFDVVIHCAAVGGSRLKRDLWKVCDDNLTMYYNLLQHRDYYGKMIHFGSGAELYDKDKPYGFSKSVIRNSILNTKGFHNIRIFSVFDHNELDTRFIKANVKRYLNGEPMVVHADKAMDMFYMEDLVKLVDHYVSNDELPKEIDCTYDRTMTLTQIAEAINKLSDRKSEITVKSEERQTDYKGKHTDLGLDFVGLEEGIRKVYEKLK